MYSSVATAPAAPLTFGSSRLVSSFHELIMDNESLNEGNAVKQEEDVANSIYAEVDAGEDTGEDEDLTEDYGHKAAEKYDARREEEEALSNAIIVALAKKRRIQHKYVRLVGDSNGERYYFPGVGTAPDFLVPAYHVNGDEYMAEELIGKYLIALERCQDGFQIKRQECPTSVRGSPLLSTGKVCGFRDQQGKQRRCGSLGAMADESGAVQVHFGDVPLSEEVEEMEPPDVSDICTPPSDNYQSLLRNYLRRIS